MSSASAQAEDEYLARREAAIGVAVAAGLLRRCEWCGAVLEGDRTRHEDAYRLGNANFTRGNFSGVFATRRQMTDAIQDAENEHGLDSCPRCDKLLSE